MKVADLLLHGQDFFSPDNSMDLLYGISRLTVTQNIYLAFKIRIPHFQPDHEPIQLCLGQKLSSGRSHRVLRRDHYKWLWQRMGHAVYRHLPLFHNLQQR